MPLLEVGSGQPSPVTHDLYIMEDGVRVEMEAFYWDASANRMVLCAKFEVLAGILFPLKFHWLDHRSRESDTSCTWQETGYFHMMDTFCLLVTLGASYDFTSISQQEKVKLPTRRLIFTALIPHLSQCPCPCHMALQFIAANINFPALWPWAWPCNLFWLTGC